MAPLFAKESSVGKTAALAVVGTMPGKHEITSVFGMYYSSMAFNMLAVAGEGTAARECSYLSLDVERKEMEWSPLYAGSAT